MRFSRAVAAFVIAPLSAPALVCTLGELSAYKNSFEPYPNPHLDQPLILAATASIAALSYGGAIMFGIPAYVWLRKRGLKTFWAWPALGFAGGAATVLVLIPVILLLAHHEKVGGLSGLSAVALVALVQGMFVAGLCGALVGTVHRLIAPPPRR